MQLSFLKKLVTFRQDPYEEFVDAFKNSTVSNAIEIAKKMEHTEPLLLVACRLLDMLSNPEDLLKRNLFMISIKRTGIKTCTIWMLYKKGILIKELYRYLNTKSTRDYIYYLSLKEVLLHGHYMLMEKGSVHECIEYLLDNLDDWELYKYALDNKIRLNSRSSTNHEYYLLHILGEKDRASRMLESRTCIEEISTIARLGGLESHPDPVIDCIIELENAGFSYGLLRRAYDVYANQKSFLSVKMVVACLVASKKAELLVLALYISFKHRNEFEQNHEMHVIYMFLCRYFCFYTCVVDTMRLLNIKNIQIVSMSFVWSDILFTKRIGVHSAANRVTAEMSKRICEVNEMIECCVDELRKGIRYLIVSGNLPHAIDAAEHRRSLIGCAVVREMSERKIVASEASNAFCSMLGKSARYLFEKMTKERIPTSESMFLTDKDVQSPDSMDGLLENELCSIDDEVFCVFFKSCMAQSLADRMLEK
ncbi:hypothetical protein HK407_03g05140 [Ordospora pajunii]|uniref:uncharacterized protein n=1 Tax=Ordospora pajunii TaxID=3039483 RepID=UPI00295268A4|nr:uncharacterized protein HK407_03g05140 [Ordospora pajunii]KAH9411764.1 hypothetical protein HK407_03g05140 [Ordospora pajunii]